MGRTGQTAVKLVGPTVKGATNAAGFTGTVEQPCASVPAGICKGTKFQIIASDQNYRKVCKIDAGVIAGLGQLIGSSNAYPLALENLCHF